MIEFEFKFKDEHGLHARPAGTLVKKVKELTSVVTIRQGKKSARADQLFALMGLGVSGEKRTVLVRVEGKNEVQDAEDLKRFMNEQFS